MLNVGLTQLGNSAQLYVARGVMFVQLGKYENAVADFKKAEALDPNQSFSSVAQGLANLQENKLDAALTSTKDELKRDPRNAFLHYLLAETLRQKGVTPPSMEFNEAVEETRAAIRLKPDYPIAEDLLGSFYLKEEKVQLAQQQFESALRHDPSNESAIYHMITVARKTGHTSQVPGLVKRLAAAKAADKKRDDLAGQFMLVEAK
jgi:tetratricopeptide (TPR) repeat protein